MDGTSVVTIPIDFAREVQQGVMRYTYRGVPLWKSPFDLALYTMLIGELRPQSIIEIGSGKGGSALWFADQLRAHGIEGGTVMSIDLEPPGRPAPLHNRGEVFFYRADANDLGAFFGGADNPPCTMLPRPLLVVEDADHQADTTHRVLGFFHDWLRPGDYIVIEDGNVPDLYPDWKVGGGPLEGLRRFLLERDEYEVDRRLADWYGPNVTFCPDGWLRRIR